MVTAAYILKNCSKMTVGDILKLLDKDVQTFITTTEINKVDKKILKNAKIFKLDNGTIEEDGHE